MPSPPPVYCTASLAHPRRRRRNQLLPLRTHLSFSSSLNEPFSPFQIRHSGERGISLHSLGGGAAYNQDRQRHTAPSKREGGRTHFLPFLCDGDGSPRSPFSPLIPGYPKLMRRRRRRRRRRKQAVLVAYFPSLHPPIAPRASQKKYRGKEERTLPRPIVREDGDSWKLFGSPFRDSCIMSRRVRHFKVIV